MFIEPDYTRISIVKVSFINTLIIKHEVLGSSEEHLRQRKGRFP